MRRLAALALLLSLASDAGPYAMRFLAPGGPGRNGKAKIKSIENAIAAGDKAGNWYALKTDGTMLASSALTLTATSSPGVSPLTFNGAGNGYFVSSAVAFPTGDFSVVMVLNTPSCTGALKTLVGNYNATNYQFLLSCVSGSIELDIQAAGGGFGTVTHSPTLGSYIVCGFTYTTATGAVKLRCEGTNHTGTAAGGGLINLGGNRAHAVGAATTGVQAWTGTSRGLFLSEKILSDSDIDRIGGGAL